MRVKFDSSDYSRYKWIPGAILEILYLGDVYSKYAPHIDYYKV